MATYKRPGVFVEETLKPLTATASDPGEAVAAFVGVAKQGPTEPTLITSWGQYVTRFGDFGDGTNLLPFSVYEFFNNGGHTAWIVRAANANAVAATVSLMDTQGTPAATLTVTAIAPGVWGNSINVSTSAVAATGTAGRFNFFVYYGGTADGNIVERYLDVTLDPTDGRYLPNIINSPTTGSSYIRVTDVPSNDTWGVTKSPAFVTNTALATGSDGTGTPDLAAAAYKLEGNSSNLILNLPGVNDSSTINSVTAWAADQGTVFVVVDGPAAATGATSAQTATAYVTVADGLTATSHAALYGPWLRVDDPANRVPGSMRLLPPGGAVIGQYIRTDASRGVQKPPAGLDTRLRGVLDVEVRWLGASLDTLNERGINVVRQVPGNGVCIMGARTLKSGMPDRYVSIRRSLQYIRRALIESTRFAIFEANNENLWEELNAVVTQILTGMLQAGMLTGDSPETSFFVKCDAENNPPAQVASGTVVIEVGVALSAPAEFIVIRIGQFEGGATTTETVAA